MRSVENPPQSAWQKMRESTPLWGALGIAVGPVALAIPPSYQWVALPIAWAFFVMAASAAASHISRRSVARAVKYGGATGSAAALCALYALVLAPPDSAIASLFNHHQKVVAAASTRGNSLDQTIQLECHWTQVPDTIPAEGWREIQTEGAATGSYGMVGTILPPGSKNNMKGLDFPDQIYYCEFTNFGSAPVVNVEATLTATFSSIEWASNGMGSHNGNVVSTTEIVTPRVNLGVQANNKQGFFVQNDGSNYVAVFLPHLARAQAVGSPEWQTATLIPAQVGDFYLQPFIRGVSTDLLSLFMADLKRDEPEAKLVPINLGAGQWALAGIVAKAEIESNFSYFYVPQSISFRSAEMLASGWDRWWTQHRANPAPVVRVVLVCETSLSDAERTKLIGLAARPTTIAEIRGPEYLAAAISGLRTAARKVPPKYEMKEGVPHLAGN